jgi:branched-chain amino acid transport system permease protein
MHKVKRIIPQVLGKMTIEIPIQALINGILLGGLFASAAAGFSLIFGVMEIVDLSHGVQVLLGAYIGYYALHIVGIDPLLSMGLAFVIVFVLGYIYQRTLIQPVLDEAEIKVLLVTFGIAMVMTNLMVQFFSGNYQTITPSYLDSSIFIVGLTIPLSRSVSLIFALIIVGLLYLFLQYTDTGRAIRATSQDPMGASLSGIDVDHTYAITFALGAGLSAAAGILIGIASPFNPSQEAVYTIQAFVIVVLGGIGSIPGVIVGGVVLGVLMSLGSAIFGALIQDVVMFVLLVLILAVKPSGLFGHSLAGGKT